VLPAPDRRIGLRWISASIRADIEENATAAVLQRGTPMLAKSTLCGACLVLLSSASAVGCSADDGAGGNSDSNFTGSNKPVTWEKDIQVKPFSVPLSKTFKDIPITRFGITVTPTLTASGSFGLKDSELHVIVQYTANPPRVTLLDVNSRGTWTASARLDLDVKAGADFKVAAPDIKKSFSTGTSLGGKAFEIAKLPIAVLPLPQAPQIQLQLDHELAAACELDFDAELHAFAEVAVEGQATSDVFYNPSAPKHVGFKANDGLTKADMFHTTTKPHVAFKDGNLAQVKGRCSVQPSINATAALGADPTHPLADVGVKFIVEPYAEFDATFKSMQDWSVDAKTGIAGTITPFGDFFGQAFNSPIDFKIFDFELARGPSSSSDTLTVAGVGIPLPDGSNPPPPDPPPPSPSP
jgi:hypothetical protein